MSDFEVRYCPDVDPQSIVNRIIRNPNYGGTLTEVPGTCTVPIRDSGIKPKTRQAIQESIKREGFRNPILVYATKSGTHLSFGGGRLMAAKALDTPIPAIVVDYVGDYLLSEEVTPFNWRDFFTDVPVNFTFESYGISTHYGLERTRDEWYDPAGVEWAQTLDDNEFLTEESPWLGETE